MKKKAIAFGAAFAAVAAVVALVSVRGGGGEGPGDLYATVQEGPLVISVEEFGEIVPSQQIVLKNEVQGRSSIISLIPEGSIVEEGDLLVQLDVSDKIDEKDNQEIVLQNAESALEVAREALEIQKNQSASDVELAEEAYTFAKEDLEKYQEGEYPAKLVNQKGQLALKEQQVKQAKDKYEWSKKLFAENFISETELESDGLSWKSSQLSLETAQRELEVLETYTHRRDLAKYKSDVKQKEMALVRARKKAASAIAQSESSLRARESEYRKQRQRLDKLTNQIAKATIRAPRSGQVVYANESYRSREPLQEGQEVWERQELIRLPTADTFAAKINLHEANLKSISTGMPVRVRCDAVPGRVFTGFVSKIAPMPDNERRWMNQDLKEYPTEVLLDGGAGEIKNGMGCKVEIIIEQYERALYVPVQCVVRIAGASFAWRRGASGGERVPVETGLANNKFIRILSGLRAGDEVMLAPPLSDSVGGAETELAKEPAAEEAK
ncbi:MAG: HlyD family efflux transporter periplasmic adaptor subunit [Kiritimatiellae bacterium]|nr:HlyD family efflux transporter periplasmic adaptor subunit [Kiritimatiellia bacterium]